MKELNCECKKKAGDGLVVSKFGDCKCNKPGSKNKTNYSKIDILLKE